MPRRVILYIGIGIAVFTALLMYLMQDSPQINPFKFKKKKIENVFDNWEESFKLEESNATGISLFNELIEYKTKKRSEVIEHEFTAYDFKDSNTTYIFVGNQFQLKTEEFDSLMEQVKKGANLFISYKDLSSNMFSYFFQKSGFMYDFSEYAHVYAGDSIYKLNGVYQGDTIALKWNFYNFEHVKEDANEDVEFVYSMSEIHGYSNFLDFGIGAGHVYLHSNPELFQNYQLLSPNGFNYSQYVIDVIPKEHQVKWLELGRFDNDGSDQNGSEDETGQEDNSYLQFIFKNKALTFALLLTLLGIIIFLIFRTKRSQPLVPYVAQKGNQSLAFAETIKEIYYKKQSPHSILMVMKRNFYVAVQKQFFVDISKENRNLELKALSEKTGIKTDEIVEFLKKLECKREILIDYAYLEGVSDWQQKFYHQKGIIKDRVKNKIQVKSKIFKRKLFLPILLLIFGIAMLLFAFYLLHKSEGIGISLWPLGIFTLGVGIRLYGLPLLTIENNDLTFHYLFAKRVCISIELIDQVLVNQNRTIFKTEDKSFVVNHTELSVYDKHAYEQFIFPFLNKSL